ncbi:MAG: ferredoxin-thioredoxin reductase catalytic domain-containing protein [candidate division WOR-3 bacterium]
MSGRFSDKTIKAWEKLNREAEEGGYRLNPDKEFTLGLVEALLTNEQRYGYWACPCRLAFGVKEKDLDIICPCDYRDDDLNEFGACYCALYVSDDWIAGKLPHKSIPERRPEKFMAEGYSARPAAAKSAADTGKTSLPYPVWRCKVCGYLCARESPPGKCPVCKAGKDRFERFM